MTTSTLRLRGEMAVGDSDATPERQSFRSFIVMLLEPTPLVGHVTHIENDCEEMFKCEESWLIEGCC
ncbi:hypothetical protein PCANC_17133 [Puccinia coronata f. sp. avenae]|uniref:Uncharacterized protein n=1 Tax=Puccinia coronata f. sp. avenae TaxID=200324 RepID=A0A2N5U1B0_9BASI|nr:hypothetical protein PCANC_18324 [Puccinia coronata f. sp. avenae]PLW31531.1 hypothetical protein PCANC_17133 [Puccinia coronata f. sp. avenae]